MGGHVFELQRKRTTMRAIPNNQIIIPSTCKLTLQIGDVIEIDEGCVVRTNIPRHFVYSNRQGDFSVVREKVTIGGVLGYLAGRYVVYKTAIEEWNYPDGGKGRGVRVWCEKIDNNGCDVDFMQGGESDLVMDKIKKVGKMERRWVYVADTKRSMKYCGDCEWSGNEDDLLCKYNKDETILFMCPKCGSRILFCEESKHRSFAQPK
jgi:predicted RNA-binding Zn-ribbon protein involved in translation (DUF1610 family)